MENLCRNCTLGIALLLTSAGCASTPATTFDPARLSDHVRVLSGDDFGGRGIATPGEAKTVDYLVRAFTEAGAQPGGEDGGWTQAVPVIRFRTVGTTTASYTSGGRTIPLRPGEDVALQSFHPIPRVEVREAPLVFVGYGVSAPEKGWDDFKGQDLKGRMLVVLVNDPDFETPAGAFEGKAMTYYGRRTYKYEEAARRGAIGVLIVHETGPAGYGWDTVRNSTSALQYDIARTDPAGERPLIEGWIHLDAARTMFRDAGLDFEGQKRAAQRPDFRPVVLPATFSTSSALEIERAETRNVIARLPGRSRASESLVYMAHWDHLGEGEGEDAGQGKPIFNGALDNGTGLAALVELARAFSRTPTERSVVFLATTGEESGMLGAEQYIARPPWPLETTAAAVNMDTMAASGPARNLVLVGAGKSDLDDALSRAAARLGMTVQPEEHPEQGGFFRSDHFPFARRGVPVLPVMELGGGLDLIEGGRTATEAWNADYLAKRYHQPADEWSPALDFRGIAQRLAVLHAAGLDLANSRTWPQWRAGAEFKAVRDASAAARR